MAILQNILRTKGLQYVTDTHKIIVRRHTIYQNLVVFTYNMIESDLNEQICQESRGIILDENNNWAVVSRSFDKFFNYTEKPNSQFDWSSAKFFKKEDGTMISLYHYNNEWMIGTTGSADAMGSTQNGRTFKDLFWNTFAICNGDLSNLNRNNTYIFELCTFDNKIVVYHDRPYLTLLAVRNHNGTWEESHPIGGIQVVEAFDIASVEEAIHQFKNLDGAKFEGFVARDKDYNLIKIKHPKYIDLHRCLDGKLSSNKKLVNLFLTNEHTEIISYFPEFKDRFDLIESNYISLEKSVTEIFDSLKHIELQKDFAKETISKHKKYSSILFAMRNSNHSFRTILCNLTSTTILEYLGPQCQTS